MTTYAFDFYNLYLPPGTEYKNEEYGIRIAPLKVAEEFEEHRRDFDSKFRNGYVKTAKVFLNHDEERAREIANFLSYLFSFTQMRDVTFDTYYPYSEGYRSRTRNSTYSLNIDNRNHRIVSGIRTGGQYTKDISEFIDVTVETFFSGSEFEQDDILGTLSLMLHAEEDTLWMIKFLFLWVVLESNANKNYDGYQEEHGEIFSDEEIKQIHTAILDHAQDELNREQINHLEHRFGERYLYEASSKLKIKLYLDYIDIGFNQNELEEIIQLAREVRNPTIHKINTQKLKNNTDIVIQLRKIAIFITLRKLGIDKSLQKRLVMPNLMGLDIEYDDVPFTH